MQKTLKGGHMQQAATQEQQAYTVQVAEAGFSINVKMIDLFGNEVMLTFRAPLASHANKLLGWYEVEIEQLIKRGWKLLANGAARATESAPQAGGVPVCPVHGSAMRESRKPGEYFCSKKLADGSYCKAKG